MPGPRIDIVGCSLALVALCASSHVLAQRKEETSVGRGCYPIHVSVSDAPPTTGRRPNEPPSFSASEVLDLEVEIRLARFTRADTVEVKFFTPEGHLYQAMSVAVPPERDVGERNGPPRGRRRIASARLPVAGTTIVNSALYGTWRVEAYLDGAPSPCARALELIIRP